MSRINDLISALFRRITAKKIFLYTLAVFLIILPISIAVIITSSTGNAKTSESTISVTLKDTDGKVLASEVSSSRDLGGETLTSIIYNLNEGKTKTEASPIIEENVAPLIIIIETENDSAELVCYFSLTGNTSYCTDESGVSYLLNALDATDFLTSKYSEILYQNAIQPALKTIDNETVLPLSLSWSYKNVSGDFIAATPQKLGSPDDEYSITGQIDVAFSIDPTYSQATVYDKLGEKIFQGSLDGLKNLIVYAKDSVRVVIDAYWTKTASSTYYGSARYDFNVIIANRSDFSISETTLDKDGFIIIEATNIEDLSKINFRSEQSSLTPKFILIGNKIAEAILTYPSDLGTDVEEFTFSISYRASVEMFTVKLDSDEHESYYSADIPCPLDAKDLNKSLSNEIKSHISSIRSGSALSYNSYNPNFIALSDFGFSKNIDFGTKILYPDQSESVFTSIGCEFVSDSYGISVPALNAGMVIKVGEADTLGKFVVVDHGMGLNVWYCNLSDVDVKENALVTKGQSIGKTYKSKISGKEGFSIYVTFEYKMIDPNEIIN